MVSLAPGRPEMHDAGLDASTTRFWVENLNLLDIAPFCRVGVGVEVGVGAWAYMFACVLDASTKVPTPTPTQAPTPTSTPTPTRKMTPFPPNSSFRARIEFSTHRDRRHAFQDVPEPTRPLPEPKIDFSDPSEFYNRLPVIFT